MTVSMGMWEKEFGDYLVPYALDTGTGFLILLVLVRFCMRLTGNLR